ncbi:DNA-directed RNA polymerase specialized sigma subunit, sigma24 family [Streptomyces sp. WMMB 714]|uniref:sigma-70 family RNA polymerase sigma factor n=1 Tax=Streptomyces sp. WMMB 714 TaxID=1286822 RepID=UPI000823F0CD|nr:sigma-70 family RNA polymerase sigma factor [Streptomyces sp. WMMB 714]SCK42155.1 DNA-directed RNA polymerase specialized sigma subunit, sigma24 family [Streptomyces sp. WMMB 714]
MDSRTATAEHRTHLPPGRPPGPLRPLHERPPQLPPRLRRLVAAECAAEAPAAGVEPEDLQQEVWLRWLEREHAGRGATPEDRRGAPEDPSVKWLRSAVRAEARRARRRAGREVPLPREGVTGLSGSAPLHQPAELPVLAAEHRRLLDAAVTRLPGRCPALLRAMLSQWDLTYPEIARELGMSQGSLGPLRSRCLGCLRTMLAASDCGT